MVAKGATKKAAPKLKGSKPEVKKAITKEKSSGNRCGAVDEDFEVDGDERHTGECVFFNRKGGFGFLKMETEGLCEENKVMVHWSGLQSEDRWPYLMRGTKCEFSLEKKRDKDGWTLRAVNVCPPEGGKFALQDEVDDQKEFVGDKNMRFTGKVKFFDFSKGFGYVKLEEGYDIPSDVPTEFRIDREEIQAGDDAPRVDKEMEIEFGIQKSTKGIYSCYNVTLPGGEDITRFVVEGREMASDDTLSGEVHFYWIDKRYGFVKPDNASDIPQKVRDILKKAGEKATKKGKEVCENALYFRQQDKADKTQRLSRGDKVTFRVYTDKQGAGACDVLQA